jgi:hypothetical protein
MDTYKRGEVTPLKLECIGYIPEIIQNHQDTPQVHLCPRPSFYKILINKFQRKSKLNEIYIFCE